MPTAAIYLRVSTDEQAREGVSLAVQEQACRAAALAAGFSNVVTFRDDGYSGTSLKRPALQELLTRLHEWEAVFVWRLDRLSRSVADWSALLRRFQEASVGFHSVTERVDATSPMGRAMLGVMAVFAELFVDVLKENVKAALQHVAESGRRPTGIAYGYIRRDKALVIVPEEAQIVREVFRRVAKGEPWVHIAQDLNARQVPLKAGGVVWYSQHIRNLVTQPLYLGKFRWRGEVLPGNHEPLVSASAWRQVQSIIAARAHTGGRPARHLTSLFRCGLCGGACTINVRRAREETYIHCSVRAVDPTAHRYVGVAEAKLVAVVWRHTELLLAEGDMGRALEAAKARREGGSERRRALQRRLREIAEALGRAVRLAHAGVPQDVIERENAPLVLEGEQLEGELRGLVAGPEGRDLERWAAQGSAGVVRASREQLPVEQQLILLRRVYERVEIFPDRVRFVYRGAVLPPQERLLPRYFAPKRGIVDVGF